MPPRLSANSKAAIAILGYNPFFTSGGTRHSLNVNLLVKNKIDIHGFRALCRVHKKKDKILKQMEETDDVARLRELASKVMVYEYQLQDLWKFKMDAKYHKWWLLPKCTCPKLDNEDIYPSSITYMSGECPIHSGIKPDASFEELCNILEK